MNYHLMVDDKFIDGFIETAEKVAPGNNHYCFLFSPPGKYVKSARGEFYSLAGEEFHTLLRGLTSNDRVFVHWFYDALMPCINLIPPDVPLYLMFWGGDFLEYAEEFVDFNLEPATKKLVNRLDHLAVWYPTLNPAKLLKQVKDYFGTNRRWKQYRSSAVEVRKAFMQRLDYFCHWNERDLERLKSVYGGEPVFRTFFYDGGLGKVALMQDDQDRETITVWLGNSATFPNNHLDAIKVLLKFKNEEIKLIAPLSYGNKRYAKAVAAAGRSAFQNKFQPLSDFLPLDQYISLLKEVDVVLMYHNRSQAAGNILAFLKMGKKVYLKEESSIYQLAIANNIIVFNANRIGEISFDDFITPLTAAQRENNFRIVERLFSDELYEQNIKALLN